MTQKSNAARDDLERFLHERLEALHSDMAWRCEASNLTPIDWRYLMLMSFLNATVSLIAQHTDPKEDKNVVRIIYQMILEARREFLKRDAS